MIVTFHHSHAYDWKVVEKKDVKDGDVLATNIKGEMTKRVSVPSTHTTVKFAGGAVDLIIAERKASPANRRPTGRKPVIAELLADGAAAMHFDSAHLTDITIDPPDADLRAYLLEHFDVQVKKEKP